jgi:hypothetical protein
MTLFPSVTGEVLMEIPIPIANKAAGALRARTALSGKVATLLPAGSEF